MMAMASEHFRDTAIATGGLPDVAVEVFDREQGARGLWRRRVELS